MEEEVPLPSTRAQDLILAFPANPCVVCDKVELPAAIAYRSLRHETRRLRTDGKAIIPPGQVR
jgi:hypothetical protein